jgi:hypothetical protein
MKKVLVYKRFKPAYNLPAKFEGKRPCKACYDHGNAIFDGNSRRTVKVVTTMRDTEIAAQNSEAEFYKGEPLLMPFGEDEIAQIQSDCGGAHSGINNLTDLLQKLPSQTRGGVNLAKGLTSIEILLFVWQSGKS